MADHDHGYKLMFSNPQMVEDVLRGFVHEEWVGELDFSTLEKFNPSYVSPRLDSRDNDLVWRVRWSEDRWLYVYILLEFQSRVDPYMAVRVMVYVGLLYQDLIRQKLLTPEGKLPPVLPMVLYNGDAPWGAAQEVSELVAAVPGGLDRYRPRLRYFLLDEGRLADSELASLRNVAAALFRLEKSRGPEEVERVVTALVEWLAAPEQSELRRAFGTFLTQVLLPARMPGVAISPVADLQEVKSMLAERVKDWTQQWKQEGFQEGHEKGLQEGRQEGRQEDIREIREIVLEGLEKRFGPLPEEARRRVEAYDSIGELGRLLSRLSEVSSLAGLGLS